MKYEYRSFGNGKKEDFRKHEASKVEFQGHVFVPADVARYSVEERFIGDAVGRCSSRREGFHVQMFEGRVPVGHVRTEEVRKRRPSPRTPEVIPRFI